MRPSKTFPKWGCSIALLALSLAASSCDFMDAMSATKTMPDKIDATNDQVSQTNRKMDSTNAAINETNHNMLEMQAELGAMRSVMEAMNGAMEEMRGSLEEMKGSLGEMKNSLDLMRGLMGDMKQSTSSLDGKMGETIRAIAATNSKMEKVNSAIHKQTLVVALSEMMKPEHTVNLFPPTGMMPAGQTFAEEATSNEVVQMVYVTLKDIDEVQPDSRAPQAQSREEFDHDKLAKFTSLEVIAGLMPQSNVEDAVNTEITHGGRYDGTTRQLLMLRTLFIKSILLDEDLLATPLDDLGKIDEAVTRVSNLDWIARLPFAGQISIKTRGMLNSENNVNEKFDLKMMAPMWDRLARALDSELDPQKVGHSASDQTRVQALKDRVKAFQNAWGRENPGPQG